VLPERLRVAAVTEREDVRDALVLRAGADGQVSSLAELPRGAVVGTSSQRRRAQLKHLRADAVVKELRGNVDTRLRKLDAGEYDAIVLAAAGLRRLGFDERVSATLEVDEMMPAVGQGALGVETRADGGEAHRLAARLDHAPTRAAVQAERALLRSLGGGCQVPIAAHAVVEGSRLRLGGLVAAPSGEKLLRDSIEGDASEAERVGEALAGRLMERGAASLLAGG
jgi:hydroxymethylbilane synthase